MKWTQIDKQFPSLEWVSADGHGAWKAMRAQTEAIVNHLVREVAGLPTAPIDRATACTALARAYREAFMTFGFGMGGTQETSERWKGLLGLAAAAFGEHDLVAICAGGRPLGAKVVATRTFGTNIRGLARHLATAERGRVPPSHVMAAMDELRTGFANDTLGDPRIALVAAHVFLRRIAVVEDVPAACQAWLAGEPLELEARPTVHAVAGGDDPRVVIFERYAAELDDEERAASAIDYAGATCDPRGPHGANPFVEKLGCDATTFLFVARRPIPAGWQARFDPIVVEWLGAEVDPARIAARKRDQVNQARSLLPKDRLDGVRGFGRTDAIVLGLLARTPELVVALTGGKPLTPFKAGKFFNDDFPKLARYLASALASRAKVARADVEPALLDFLAHRSPGTNGELKGGGSLHWVHLLALAGIVYGTIGEEPATEVGRALQRAVTGV